MKVLFNCHLPFMLAHGGAQIQIERTMAALESIGIKTDHLAWWNASQNCEILHHLGGLPSYYVAMAHQKKWKVAGTVLLTETCNRPAHQLFLRKLMIQSALAAPLPSFLKEHLPWRGYHACDRMIVGLEAERRIMCNVYGVSEAAVAVVPLGLTDVFLKAGPASRTENHLICTGRIDPVKNSLQLAQLARETNVPILFVGKPHDPGSQFWRQFQSMIDQKMVKHHPHVSGEQEIAALLQKARGYVLMSRFENWSLAAHEAAACGLPTLLPDQPWSRERFGSEASYWPKGGGSEALKIALRGFYERCPTMEPPKVKLHSWIEVAEMLKKVYESMLDT